MTSWRVVLVRPRNPLNIGAAARAMANFGFHDLVVVKPYGPVWRETRSAVGAEDIVQSARAVDNVAEALEGVTLALGTTSGRRRTLDRDLISLDSLPFWIKAHSKGGRGSHAAILFGSEKTGLSNEDLSYCHALVRIPTVAICPSMNLGQAVAVCCYELARASRNAKQSRKPRTTAETDIDGQEAHVWLSPPASVQSLDHLIERAVRVLDQVGYLKPKSRDAMVIKLRRVLLDRGLSNNDAKILGGVLAQIEWKLGKR